MSARWADALWALGAIAVHLAVLAGVALQNDGALQPLYGIHDATYYTAHLEDPLLRGDLDSWDNIPYRALRVGYVALALPFRWLGTVPALVLVNLAAVALGVVVIRRIGAIHGASQLWTSAIWILNPGALVATALLLPDTVAWAAILVALLAMRSRRWVLACGLTILAVLTKEASLVAVGAAAVVVGWRSRDWKPLLPVAVAGGLHITFLVALTSIFGPSFHSAFVTLPLRGWIDVWSVWEAGRPISRIVGLFVLASGLLVLLAWARRPRNEFLAAAGGQALLMLVLQEVVVFPLSNSTRIGGLFWPMLVATHPSSEEEAMAAVGGRSRTEP